MEKSRVGVSRARVALAPPARLEQIGSPVARWVACADAALSSAGFTSLARRDCARPQHRVLSFHSMTKQIVLRRCQVSSGASSLTVWAGFARTQLPPACLTADATSVYSVYWQA